MKMKPADKSSLALVAIGVVLTVSLGLANWFFDPTNTTPPINRVPTTLQISIVGAYLAAVFGFIVRSWIRLAEHDERLGKLQTTIEQQTILSLVTSRLIRSHSLIQRIGFDTLASQMSSLMGTDKGFSIT